VVAFIEVKARKDQTEALEAITMRQRQRIARAAMLYLKGRPALRNCPVRFDAILILPFRLPRHLKNAWQL